MSVSAGNATIGPDLESEEVEITDNEFEKLKGLKDKKLLDKLTKKQK